MTNHHQSDEPRENPSAKIGKYCSAMDLESASGDAAGLSDSSALCDATGLLEQLLEKSPAQRMRELEQLITHTLAKALRLEATIIKADDSLISLGLDSLIGMNLRSKLEVALQTDLPNFGLKYEATVSGLARVAAESIDTPLPNTGQKAIQVPDRSLAQSKRRGRRRRSGIVALGGAHGPGAPVFCLHPVGGDLRCYDKLSRHLRSRPVYGLRSRGLDAYSEPHPSMDQMIADYSAEIQTAVPSEPICLLGWSTGGIFARELALHMTSLGRKVEALLMIDTPMPSVFEEVDLSDSSKFLSDLVTFTNYFAGNLMQIDPKILNGLSEDQALSRVLELGMRNGVLPSHATVEFLDRLISVCKQHVKILQDYSPSLSTLNSFLIRPDDPSVLGKAAGQDLASDLGWSQFNQISLHHVPGHHFTMMTSQHASSLAAKVEQLIGS